MTYKNTLRLPKTDFPMRAGLQEKEPKILKKWDGMDLHQLIFQSRQGSEKFVLHDGPPYANGHLHIGHALNKILKDVVIRFQSMLGKQTYYVAGWDCHGLPIEWKVEEKYQKNGKKKEDVSTLEFRQECRDFAQKWVKIQKEEFQRLGILGDWKRSYITMDYAFEASVVEEFHKFLLKGWVYRGARPIMWSPVEKTSLAEAEIEYKDHQTTQIWVAFEVKKSSKNFLRETSVVIWTTTPWTIPANKAVGYGENFFYVVLQIQEILETALMEKGRNLVIAKDLVESFCKSVGIVHYKIVHEFLGDQLEGTRLAHPLREQGYDQDVPMLPGDFVTLDQGTGCVHMAPSHGVDDFNLCEKYGITSKMYVGDDGRYTQDVLLFAGKHVYKVAPEIVDALKISKNLMHCAPLIHSYPHSWRSKAPLIYRTVPQWFIGVDQGTPTLREQVLGEMDRVKWMPSAAKARMAAMVQMRPDWCVSRQRAWGVPLALFVHKETGEVLRDSKVCETIADIFREEGADAWFIRSAQDFLGEKYPAIDYEMVLDILDVWFESGSTHAAVLETYEELHWPADLYLEGSDQHRGWFQSSLLESCGTRGKAPFKNVLTHGFVLDEKGYKMSKSLGNVVGPHEIIQEYGADILRLWVVSADYTGDLRIGSQILNQVSDSYRRIRNTLRFMLGNLQDFSNIQSLNYERVKELPELEQYMLQRLQALDKKVRQRIEAYDFHSLLGDLHHWCAFELSAFYFDIRKDILYCEHSDSFELQGAKTVLFLIWKTLVKWIAPILPFTADEAWQSYYRVERCTIAQEILEDLSFVPEDLQLDQKWQKIILVRRLVLGALEKAREEKLIGSSLQGHVHIYCDDSLDFFPFLKETCMEDICLVSKVDIHGQAPTEDVQNVFLLEDLLGDRIGAVVRVHSGKKCERCWKMHDLGEDLCMRCQNVLKKGGMNAP